MIARSRPRNCKTVSTKSSKVNRAASLKTKSACKHGQSQLQQLKLSRIQGVHSWNCFAARFDNWGKDLYRVTVERAVCAL